MINQTSSQLVSSRQPICLYHPNGRHSLSAWQKKNQIIARPYDISASQFLLKNTAQNTTKTNEVQTKWLYAPGVVAYLALMPEMLNFKQLAGIIIDDSATVGSFQLMVMKTILLKQRWLMGSDVESLSLRQHLNKNGFYRTKITIGTWLKAIKTIQAYNKRPPVALLEVARFKAEFSLS